MSTPKWQGGVAIVRASSASDAPSTGYVYPVCESANIERTPLVAKRAPNIVPDVDQLIMNGFDYIWNINGITPNANVFGYLMAVALGGDAFSLPDHTITPADDGQYANILVDRGLDLGTSTPTERLLGAKVDGFSLEFPQNEFAKLAVTGPGCDMGTLAAALTPSIPTGDDEAALSWAALQDASGYFKIGLNEGATAQDDDIKGFKLDYGRPTSKAGVTLGSPQPAAIHHGLRDLTFEITKEFSGTSAKDQYIAWAAQQEFAVELKAMLGANYVTMIKIYGYPTANYPGEVGAGEEVITGIIQCQAYKKTTNDLISWTVKDGTTALYWT